MTNQGSNAPHYEFSEKYDPEHARKYFHKHNTSFWRRLSNWREISMARKAQARGTDLPRDRFLFSQADIKRDFASAGLPCRFHQILGQVAYLRTWHDGRGIKCRFISSADGVR